jgi:hypothetical protein
MVIVALAPLALQAKVSKMLQKNGLATPVPVCKVNWNNEEPKSADG